MPASYFDVNGTLLRATLVEPTVYYLRNLGTPLKSARMLVGALRRAPGMLFAELRDRQRFNEVLYSCYAGLSEDRLVVLAEELYEEVLRPALFAGARELVAEAQQEGREVVLVSGALEPMLRPLAAELGVSRVIANRLEMQGGYATGRLEGAVVAGRVKGELVRRDAAAHGHALEACAAFGDSYSDLAMLSAVGRPSAVNPDARLRRAASARDWPVLELTR